MIHLLITLYKHWDEQRRDLGVSLHVDPATNNIVWTGKVDGKMTVLDLHKFLQKEFENEQ